MNQEILHFIIGLVVIIIMGLTVFFITKLVVKGIIKIIKYFKKDKGIDLSNLTLTASNEIEISQPKSYSSINKFWNFILILIKMPFIIIGKLFKGIIYIMQHHCPKCDGTDIKKLGSKEIDRWNSNKRVTERLASGKTKTRYVNITKVKIRHYYLCQTCGHEFTEHEEREK